MTANPYETCAAGAAGLALWACHVAVWAYPALSTATLVLSLFVSSAGALNIILRWWRRPRWPKNR